jgi:tetratricopeptide (TPR) repeat protein
MPNFVMLSPAGSAIVACLLLCSALGAEIEVGAKGAQSEFDEHLLAKLCTFDTTDPGSDEFGEIATMKGNLDCSPAEFGAGASFASGKIALVEPANGCQPVLDIKNQVAIIKRGGCTFYTKYLNAKKAGAAGVIIYDFTTNVVPLTLVRDDDSAEEEEDPIPCVAILYADGNRITTSLEKARGEATLQFSYQDSWQDLVLEGKQKRLLKTDKYSADARFVLSAAYLAQGKLEKALKTLKQLLKLLLKQETTPTSEWSYQDVALRFFKIGIVMERNASPAVSKLAAQAYSGAVEVCFLLKEGFTAFQIQLKTGNSPALGRSDQQLSEAEFNIALHLSFSAEGEACMQPLLPLLVTTSAKHGKKKSKPKVEALLAKLACHVRLGESEEATATADLVVKRSAKMGVMYPGLLSSASIDSLKVAAAAFRGDLYTRTEQAVDDSAMKFFV